MASSCSPRFAEKQRADWPLRRDVFNLVHRLPQEEALPAAAQSFPVNHRPPLALRRRPAGAVFGWLARITVASAVVESLSRDSTHGASFAAAKAVAARPCVAHKVLPKVICSTPWRRGFCSREHIDTEAHGAITFRVTAVAIYALRGGIVRSNMLREKGNSRFRAVLRLPPRHPSPERGARSVGQRTDV
jgi:hypothetical protein